MRVSNLLDGKVALVTGASRNIGAATARLLAEHGAKVGVNYVEAQDRADEVVRDITDDGGEAIPLQADVTDISQVEGMVKTLADRWGSVDILINNARPMPMTRETYFDMTPDLLEARVVAELRSIDNCCRLAFPYMKEKGWGRIVNVTSVAGRRAALDRVAYSVAKAAMESLSKSIAMSFAPYGITVNLLAPGTVVTDRIASRMTPEQLARQSEGTPLGKLASNEDIAGSILVLVLDEARFVTGQYLYASGGTVMP
jgi:3-oxoacyl-[acyl-carrier protein] reductase